jgi:hypothetical protein
LLRPRRREDRQGHRHPPGATDCRSDDRNTLPACGVGSASAKRPSVTRGKRPLAPPTTKREPEGPMTLGDMRSLRPRSLDGPRGDDAVRHQGTSAIA